jgi:xylose isomerase
MWVPVGPALTISAAVKTPKCAGCLLISSNAIRAGLDPVHKIAFGLATGKLCGAQLDDQNGIKFDRDKSFGVENLRQAFNGIRMLMENGYGKTGEYIGIDVMAMSTQKEEICCRHIENSLKIAKVLETKAERFDYNYQRICMQVRDCETLGMYVMDLLMNS